MNTRTSRRRFGVGLLSVLGASSVARPIKASPRGAIDATDPARVIAPRESTSVAQGVTEITHFETNTAGGVVGGVRTTVGGPAASFEQFDMSATGCVRPFAKTTAEGPLTTFELFDSHGAQGRFEVVLAKPDLDFAVRVSSRRYRLVAGRLTEETS